MNLLESIKELEVIHNIKLRPQQEQIIKFVLYQWLHKGQKNVFIEAPTGSGKSFIAFFISEILNKIKRDGYILTSDISLQNQYVEDSKKLKFYRPDVKGVDNYLCTENGKPYSQGSCKQRHLDTARQKKLKCYDNCPYIKARKLASESDTCILNYNYFLLMHNYVRKNLGEKSPFQVRNFTIYDEAHKIIDIVQDMYAPVINKHIYDTIETFEYELNKNNFIFEEKVLFAKKFYDIFTGLRLSTDKKFSFSLLEELYQYLIEFKHTIKDPLLSWVELQFERENFEVFDSLYLLEFTKIIDDFYCKIEDYVDLIKNTGLDSMFINNQEYHTKYNFINEHFLIKKNLLDHSNFNLFMSATLGEEFPSMLGCTNFVYRTIDSDFDFEKSPIYVYKNFNVNYSNRETLFPKMLEELDKIVTQGHTDDRGLIHTASYMNTKYIKENSLHKTRLIDYEGSSEKEVAIDTLKQSNFILMGPSLLEGIDLKDDWSRFQVIFKIPYPSLADRFVKYKFEKNKAWYSWVTKIKIQQALGRSIRHKDDFAVSYILDSNIIKMIPSFPDYIKKRITVL